MLAEPLSRVVAQARLREIPGVGAALAGVIRDLHIQGSTQRLDELRKAIPASVLDMLAIPSLRPQKILALHRVGVSSVEALEAAARSHELDHVKGFGPAFGAQALSAIDLMRRAAGQLHRHTAEQRADRIVTAIARAHPELSRLTPAGDLRRGAELVGDLCFVAEVMDRSHAAFTVCEGRLKPTRDVAACQVSLDFRRKGESANLTMTTSLFWRS